MKREVKIGLTVIAGILTIYLFIAWSKSLHLFATSRTPYKIRFSNVSGLKIGDPVMVLGYPSGNVTSIGLEGGKMLVGVAIDDQIEIRQGSLAEIQVKELMGGKKVEITPSESGTVLTSGGVLDGSVSMDFSTAFSKFGSFMEQFDEKRMDELVSNLNRVASSFADLGEEIKGQDAGGTMKDLRESVATLNRMLARAENKDLIGKVDKTFGMLDTIAAKADEAMGAVTTLSHRLEDKTLPNADSLMAQIGGALTEVEGFMDDFREILNTMKQKNTVAGKLLYDPAFAKQLDKTVENLDKTLTHIRTKKIFVTMTLSKKQKRFSEEVQGEIEP